MLKAKVVGLDSRPTQEVVGKQLAVYEPSGNLIAIFVMIAPGVCRPYFVGDNPEEFKRVAASLGIGTKTTVQVSEY